jgi:ABC-type phosphate transport system substrate-binding protein
MTSPRKRLGLLHGSRAVLGLGLLATLITACSLLLDTGRNQCESDTDCDFISKQHTCQAGICSDLGPRGCYAGPPSSTNPAELQSQFKNQCSRAQVVPFANCERLGLCRATDELPPAVMPTQTPGGGTAPPPPPAPTLECIDGTRQVVVVGGSTAIQPFLSVVAPLVSAQGFQIVYQPSGSCTGVTGVFSPDASKRVVKDIPGRYAVLISPDGKSSPQCTFSTQNGAPPVTPVALDVAASDVFASSCDPANTAGSQIGEYFGPIQPMTFVVKSESKETSISAEMGHFVFGRGNTDIGKAPFRDPAMYPYIKPALYFVRNSGSGTQQMIARAIKVDATQWWGVDRGGSTQVQMQMQLINSADFNNAVGILSTDFADSVRGSLRILAFQDTGQLAAYYPDSTLTTRDKRNVRDGHYSIWGPVHFFAQLTTNNNTLPNAAAQALVSKFTATKLDQSLLDAIIKSGLVPPCAMTVKRSSEMGPLEPFISPAACGCYFEAKVPEGQAPASCQTCSGPTECPGDRPACNYGYCEPVPR